jgi:hypothetical protein
VLALLVLELGPAAREDEVLEEILDAWTIQAVAGFTGCMPPGLDEHLAGCPHPVAAVTAAAGTDLPAAEACGIRCWVVLDAGGGAGAGRCRRALPFQ